MNSKPLTTIIEFLKSEKGKTIIKDVVFYSENIKKVIDDIVDIYKKFNTKRERAYEDGFTRNQHFENEMDEFQEEKEAFEKGYSFEDFFKEQMDNIKETLNSKFDFENKEWFISIKNFKMFLTDDINEEEFKELVGKFTRIIINIPNFDALKDSIGNEKYEKLVSIVVTHSLNITKALYERATEKIDELQFKHKFKNLYENYVLTVLRFVKENDFLQSQGLNILNFAFGNKAAAIQSFVVAVAVELIDEEKREKIVYKMKNAVYTANSWFRQKVNKFKRKNKESMYEDYQA